MKLRRRINYWLNILKVVCYIIFSILLTTMVVCTAAYGQVTINNVVTTASSCPNNGSITIQAQVTTPPILYSIVSGPVTQPAQTNATFNSIPSGNYMVQVSDGLGNNRTQNVTVPGNYQALDFRTTVTNPTCSGSSDGRITANVVNNKGLGPFTWEIIAPSPVVRPSQTSNTFTNLPAGNYSIRLTDACGAFRTLVVSLTNPGDPNLRFFIAPEVELYGCDTALVSVLMSADTYKNPITFKYDTPNGSYTTTTSSLNLGNGRFQYLVPNITYGSSIKVTATDACGNTVTTPTYTVRTLGLCPSYTYEFVECEYRSKVSFNINNPGCTRTNETTTYMKAPVSYQLTDVSTNTIVETGTVIRGAGINTYERAYGIPIKQLLPGNKQYRLSITDGCGNTYTNSYNIPNPVAKASKIFQKDVGKMGCIDSVAMAIIYVDNFKTTPRIIFLSGPATLGSTKDDYAYSGTYSYPDTLLPTGKSAGYPNYSFDIHNLAVGTYKFKVIDSCGTELYDSITVRPRDVMDLKRKVTYKKGCLGKNEIHYYNPLGWGDLIIKDGNGRNYTFKQYMDYGTIRDSILNIPSGTYIVTFTDYGTPGVPLNQGIIRCPTTIDTIVIEGYQTPEIFTGNSITCGGNLLLELLPDSTKGVPPYQYEIISGPQIFPQQNSNVFQLTNTGTYTARIYDKCGNAATKQITVDNITTTFIPLVDVKTCNSVRLIYPSSNYYKHKWIKPDGSVVWSDSLIIDNITKADSGTYTISQIVTINGCSDTVTYSYEVPFYKSKNVKNVSICEGDTVKVGSNNYFSSGIYSDTLLSSLGCDSIIELHLSVWQSPVVNLGKDTSICLSQQLTLDAGSGNTYRWNGSSSATTQNTLSINAVGKYWVEVINPYGCTSADTIEVLSIKLLPQPYAGQDTIICKGQSVELAVYGNDDIEWLNEGVKQSSIIVSPTVTTNYIVKATNECGSATDEVRVIVVDNPKGPLFNNNTLIHCFEEQPLLISANTGTTFLWPNSGDTTQSTVVTQPGIYEVIVSNEFGCSLGDKITIIEICYPRIFVPDAFSPNNDGLNDRFEVFGKNFTDFEIRIFNRWGEIIFMSSDVKNQWDGNYLGEEMPIGTYPYVLSYKNVSDINEVHEMRGGITLIR